jgi:hypothetical protein
MYDELYEYFSFYKQLNVPGIGVFLLERKPAEADVASRVINPPAYTITLHHSNATPGKKFFYWLADKLNISYTDAVVRFNDFVFDIKDQVLSGARVTWLGIGVLSKGMAGEIRFEAAIKEHSFDSPVRAVKIIREKAEHTVRVGEEQRTSTEMIEWLSQAKEKISNWWGVALIIAILSVIFIGIYFSQQGLNTSSAANQQKLSPQKESLTHKMLP